MKQRLQKNIRIINDLILFCHSAGAVDYEIHFTPKHDSSFFEIRARIPDMKAKLLSELDDALKLKRTHEVEQNYWELGGETAASGELTLVGMMLDTSFAVYENGVLTITAERKE